MPAALTVREACARLGLVSDNNEQASIKAAFLKVRAASRFESKRTLAQSAQLVSY